MSQPSSLTKWRRALTGGFQTVPSVLFRAQRRLGIDAGEVVVLLNITMHWWSTDELPHPRPSVIARRMGVSTRTVERKIKSLQRKGLLHWNKSAVGLTERTFDLSGLVQRLSEFAAFYRNYYINRPPAE